MYTKIIDIEVEPQTYYEIKFIVRADEPGPKTGYIGTYCGNKIVRLEEIVIHVHDFWSTMTRYIQADSANRIAIRLNDVDLLNARSSYLDTDGSWRLHTLTYP